MRLEPGYGCFRTTEQRISQIHAIHQSYEQMNDMIERLMKKASILESDTSIPLSLKMEKAKTLERDITEKSEKNIETFRQICDKVDPFLRNEDKPPVENMARLVVITAICMLIKVCRETQNQLKYASLFRNRHLNKNVSNHVFIFH